MSPKEYEVLAQEITDIPGKYIGKAKVKLEDGSIIQLGDRVALRTIEKSKAEYPFAKKELTTILYNNYAGEWRPISLSGDIFGTESKGFGFADVKKMTEVAEEYNVPVKTLQSRLKNLVEYEDYLSLGKRQPTLLNPQGIEKIIKEK